MFNVREETSKIVTENRVTYYGLSIIIILINSVLAGISAYLPMGTWLLFFAQSFLIFLFSNMFLSVIRDDSQFSIDKHVVGNAQENGLQYFLGGVLHSIFIALWTLLLVIPGIIKRYSYAMAPYLLKDNPEMTGMEAISVSKDMMKGKKMALFLDTFYYNKWKYIAIIVTFILSIFTASAGFNYLLVSTNAPFAGLLLLTSVSGLVTLVASIYVLPYTEVTKANFYRKLTADI